MSDTNALESMRVSYLADAHSAASAATSPWQWWHNWWTQAAGDARIVEANAMVLSTLGADQSLSSRIVLCKGVSPIGFTFYTNYASRKGQAIAANPQVSAVFPWHAAQLQVQLSGNVTKVSTQDSDAYFASRPRASQLGAVASAQSEPVASREAFLAQYAQVEARYEGVPVPRPEHWGGYVIAPSEIEFWRGDAGRMHHRQVFVANRPGAVLDVADHWAASLRQS